ncbi:MAG TPA: hypothetical protein VHI52_11920 [Verrucomicrobiae bacterium]|nr:hypothetical protein [Verrucomicrobiae bacterium]
MKKYNCLLLIFVIAWGAAARAQAQPSKQHHPHRQASPHHRWSLDGAGGAAFPIGRFAHTDNDNPKSGPVHTGSLLELSGTYHLNATWGITLLAARQYHHSEIDEANTPYSGIPELLVPGPLNGMVSTPLGPQHWSMTRLLAGGVYTLPLNTKKELALLVRALAGMQKTHISAYEVFLQAQNMTGFSNYPPRNLAWAFSYQADIGIQWKACRRWSLLALAGYNGSRPSYKQDITALILNTGSTGPGASPFYQKIRFPTGSILVRAGVGYEL